MEGKMAPVLDKEHSTELVAIDVDVTPVNQCAQMVICDIDPTPGGGGGGHVTDGVIFLADGKDYTLVFHLKNGELGQFSWDVDPFWARKSKCPTHPGTPGQFPDQPQANGNDLTVTAKGVQGKSAVHFRLNMLDSGGNPVFCDPIIINN
jgi:hypothetical protein